jgi:hypothetical protein
LDGEFVGLPLIVVLLIAAVVHARMRYPGNPGAMGEMLLLYVLVGYCGVQQIVMGVAILVTGGRVLLHFGFQPGQPTFVWDSFLLLGGGITSVLAIWRRDSYLLAPVLMWSVFFAGATYAHIQLNRANGFPPTWESTAWIFTTHGLISVLLISFYLASQGYRARRTTQARLFDGSMASRV